MSFGFGMGFPRSFNAAGGPSLNFQFAGSTALDPRITFTRASTATYFNSVGVLTSAAIDAPRFDYNPSTLAAQGLLIEEARTNSIRNNTMQGAVAGTPGTLPTNWATFTSLTGLTREVVGTGTESGINYIDIRLSGTPSAAGSYNIFPEGSITTIAAVSGQTWAFTQYSKLAAGSTSGITSLQNVIIEYSAASAFLTQGASNFSPSGAALSGQRSGHTRTLTNASTAFIRSSILLSLDGAAIDITLRIGLPQLENNNIPASIGSVGVASAGGGYTAGDILTVLGGTGTPATLSVITTFGSGQITAIGIVSGGSYSVLPTGPVSVTGGTGGGATFNIVPQTKTGFATSVIPTTTTALTRSADVASVNTLSPWFNSAAGTLYCEYSRFGAVNFQACAVLGEATFQNLITLGFGSGAPSNNNRFDVNASGSSQASITLLTNPALNTVAKTAGAYATNDFAGTANGAVPGTDTSGTVPSGIAVLSIGCNSALNGGFLNGYLRRITYYPRRLSNAELVSITTP